jgi:hypothetical protein
MLRVNQGLTPSFNLTFFRLNIWSLRGLTQKGAGSYQHGLLVHPGYPVVPSLKEGCTFNTPCKLYRSQCMILCTSNLMDSPCSTLVLLSVTPWLVRQHAPHPRGGAEPIIFDWPNTKKKNQASNQIHCNLHATFGLLI